MKDFMCINQEAESKVRPKLTAQQIHLPAHIYTLSTWLEMTRFCDLYTCKWKTQTCPLPNYKLWEKIRLASRGCPQPDSWWPFPAASLIFLKKIKNPSSVTFPFFLGTCNWLIPKASTGESYPGVWACSWGTKIWKSCWEGMFSLKVKECYVPLLLCEFQRHFILRFWRLEERTGLFCYTEDRHRLEMVEKYWHK